MAEKRVSVRLVATGGRQVRAELEGVGEAGVRGFGRLSAEMDRANDRLSGFARKAGVALAAMTVAAAAAGVAMVRSGLETIGAQADMAASLKTTVESLQVLTAAGEMAGVSLGEIEQATKKLTTRLSEAATGSGSAVGALARLNLTAEALQALPLDQRILAIQDALTTLVPEAERAAVASDLFGDRAALAFLRIDAATLREAAQDVRDFGVAVSASDAAQIERTGDAIARLGLIWLGLSNRLTAAVAPALETVANALADMARGTGPVGGALTVLFGQLERLATYAGTVAALMAGRWVVGLAAAALSVRALATALVILRGALIRTGIGALVVGAGELVFQFGRLVQGAGGLGTALALLGDLAGEVWGRMKLGAVAVGLEILASWAGIRAGIAEALQASLEAVVTFGNATLNTFQGALEAVKVLWSALPASIGEFAYSAANALIGGVEAMLNGVARRIDGFLEGINAGLDVLGVEKRVPLIGTIELGGIENPFAGAAANAGVEARAAFEAAFTQTPIAAPDLGLTKVAAAARAEVEALRGTMAGVAAAATAPLQSVVALRTAVAAGSTEATSGLGGAEVAASGVEAALNGAGNAAERAGGAGRAAGGALSAAADTAKAAWEATAEAVGAAAEKSREIAQGLAQDITGPIKEALKSGEFSWETFAGAISRIAQNLATRLIELAFKPIETALLNAFMGGGGAGGGILGSLFGFAKGGVFAGGTELTAFAQGGVVNRPRLFPFAKGIGLMGEAGPEAILPLRRGKGGRLGVEMSGDGAAPAPAMSTRIINVLDPSVVGDYLATSSGERAILNVIRRNRGSLNA
jgi:hypothetical protein